LFWKTLSKTAKKKLVYPVDLGYCTLIS